MTVAILFAVVWSGSQVGLIYVLLFRRAIEESRRVLEEMGR